MHLTRHRTPAGPRWAADGKWLATGVSLGAILQQSRSEIRAFVEANVNAEAASGEPLAPIDADQEVWASGVTYLRSREAREAESSVKDVYARVYEAPRPELFFKAAGWRVVGPQEPIRVRDDSAWNVPEPELTLVINAAGEIVGYTAGNDVSSRDIEGENPLYLPQAKVYNGSCALGPGITIEAPDRLRDLPIRVTIARDSAVVFDGSIRTSQIKRPLEELAGYLYRELAFPNGAFLMTGTGVVPPHEFSMTHGDVVRISIDNLVLENPVAGRVS